jgi:hypothetical protein
MCYESLLESDGDRTAVTAHLEGEMTSAVYNGLVAAALVGLVLVTRGVAPGLVVSMALAALVLGALLHQAVLVVGVAIRRLLAEQTGPRIEFEGG